MNKNIVIFGSCVTRDAMEFNGLKDSLLYFHCRSNLASLTSSKPIKSEFDLVGLNPFLHRCVSRDLKKDFATNFENCIVIFDFLDDRFPIGTKDDSFFTYNHHVAKLNPSSYRDMGVIQHFQRNNWPLVEKLVDSFANRFADLVSRNKTILHTASFSPFYDGKDSNDEHCLMMRSYYNFLFNSLCKRISFDHVIDCMDSLVDANSTPAFHRWGHAPFHYHDAYNHCLSEKIIRIQNEESCSRSVRASGGLD
ncbi:DUF6270 domain-containing protein [Paracoccus sp. WLY502]|nr:DUF6270 domain-containing protein [Paracoccus sp. WLY502]